MSQRRRAVHYNQYFVKKKFGAGAMSRTFLVEEEENTNKLFVLKIVNYYNDDEIDRANIEIEQMQRLKSPFTVRLICSFIHDTDICMVLEYCERGDLRNEITQLQNLPEQERVMCVWEILAQMSLALNHLHSKGVLHRDIKPENVFVMADGSVRMGDFGLAKELIDKSYAQTIVGTKIYSAPEVFTLKKMDKQSDMYSLGIVVFELLTGIHPFAADSEQAM
ncbi:MAG: putative NEK/NEK1 protein kinase, partial [Streblomastix strix]